MHGGGNIIMAGLHLTNLLNQYPGRLLIIQMRQAVLPKGCFAIQNSHAYAIKPMFALKLLEQEIFLFGRKPGPVGINATKTPATRG
jgi:hypothetical protein